MAFAPFWASGSARSTVLPSSSAKKKEEMVGHRKKAMFESPIHWLAIQVCTLYTRGFCSVRSLRSLTGVELGVVREAVVCPGNGRVMIIMTMYTEGHDVLQID